MGPRWRVIPSVLDLRTFDRALETPADEVLLSNVHIGNLQALANRAREAGKRVLVQTDLIGGFRADVDGLRLLKTQYGVSGVFSSSHSTIATARKVGLARYFRVFLIDSRSLHSALEALPGMACDGVELLPSPIALQCATQFREVIGDREMLAGGFVHDTHLLEELKNAGFDGATTSTDSMWS